MSHALFWGGVAAASLLIGYFLAGTRLSKRSLGLVMAFGAGALVSAIAYELVPRSTIADQGSAFAFLTGALVFFTGDWLVDRRGGAKRKNLAGAENSGSGAAIFIGALLDAIPESLILGMGFALGGEINLAFLVAVFISNLPEGLAGTVNLAAAGVKRRRIFWSWTALVVVSALVSGFGYTIAVSLPAVDGLSAQAFAAGAMLTMLAEAMMPEAYEHGGKLVGLATVLGYLAAALLSLLQ